MTYSTITTTYSGGRGRMTINLEEFFPTTKTKINKLLRIIDMDGNSEKTEELIQKMLQHIEESIEDCKEGREGLAEAYRNYTHRSFPARAEMEEAKARYERIKPQKKQYKEEYKTRLERYKEARGTYTHIKSAQRVNLNEYNRRTKMIERYKKNRDYLYTVLGVDVPEDREETV